MPLDRPSPSDAVAGLARADAAATHGRARSRWFVWFEALLGAVLGVTTVLLGVVGTSPPRMGPSVVIAVGRPLMSDNAVAWAVAGVLVAAPLGLGAWRASRR